MSVMAEEAEREKPKFVCKLCKLDYPSSVQFEEHLWSMLHHKAINNKTSSTKHHCNLCMFESFDLNAYGKHLIGEQHKHSLVERRKRLEEPRQIKGTAPATSCSNRSDSQTAQGTNQKVKSTNWGPPTHTLSNQTSFYHGGYSQSQGPNSFQQAFKSNTDYDYEEQFIYNQGKWQNPHNPYSWHPPHGWFGQPSVGSWENKSPFNPRQRFQTPPPAVQQQYEKSIKRPGKPEAQGKVSKKKEGKNKAHWKNDNVTSTVKIRKASHHSVASKGLFAQGCHVQKPAHQHVPAEQALSDLVKRDIQSESVPYVKVARGSTPSKNQKKKKQKTPSPKIKPNGHPEQTGSTPKPSFKTKGKFAKKKIFLNSLQNQSSATSHPSPMTQAVKESQFFSKPTQSSEIASTKQSAPSEDIASSTTTFPKATSAINRFEMTLREALHGKDDVHGDEIVEVTSSDVAGVSGKAADHSATLLTSSSPMVSSSVAVTPFQFAPEQYTWEKEQSSPKAHSSSSLAADKWTFKIHHQKETIASRNKASVPETAAGLLPTLATSMSPTVSSATDAVSSFHSLHEQNGKWSAEIRCASSSDKLVSKTHSHTETTSLGTSDTLASKIHSPTETSSLGTSDELASKIHSRTETSSTSMSDKPTSKIHSHTEKSSTGMSDKSRSNIHSHTESSSTGTSDKPTSNIHSHTESSSMGMSDKPTSNIHSHTESSSTGTSDKPTSNIHSHTVRSSTGTSDKPTSNIHSHTESSSTGMSDKPTSNIHSHTESSSTGMSDKPTSNIHSHTESSSTGTSDKRTSNIHSHTESSSTGMSDKRTSNLHSRTESSGTGMSDKPTSNIHSRTGKSSTGMSDKPTSNTHSHTESSNTGTSDKPTSNIHSHTEKSSTGMSDKSTSNIHSHTESLSTGMSYKPTSNIHIHIESSGTGTSEKPTSNIHGHTESLSTGMSYKPTSNIHIHIESSSTGTSEKPTSNIHSCTESSSTSTSDKRASKMHSHTESSSTGTSDKPSSNIHSRTESSSTSTSDKPMSNILNRTESSSTGTLPEKPTYITHFGTESSSTGTSDKPTSKTHSHTESSGMDTYVQNIGLSSSTGTPEDCSNHKELVKSKSEETGSDESSTSVSNFARSSSSPATLITVASQSKELSAGNQCLLSKVLINEQQKQKLNPRPNLTNARSRLRTNKDAEHPTGGQIFKEKIQGLLSDVAKPVWQQKKLRMMLAKAKKAPDRFNRFSHPASSPSRSEDPIESLDIMNLSTEFQQELLDLIQSEDADEEDILSQLTASEANETWEGNQQDFVGRSTPAESLKSSWRHGEVTLGGIQEAVPLMSQALHERSHTVATATPVSIQQQGLQATLHPSHTVGSRSSTPVIKLERLDSTELMDSCVYQPSFGSEQLQDEGHSHPGLISSNESCAKPDERGSTERHQTVTSASPVFNQEPPTFADLDTQALQPSQPYKEQNHPGHFAPENPDDRREEGGPTERHDASVTSTSTIPSMTVDPDSTEETEMITKVHKHKKKKSKKSKSKEKDPSTSKKVKKTSPQEKTPKLKESKSPSSRRKSVQSSLSVRVSRTKSPAVLTATKLKKKLKQKRNMLDTMVGDMSNLLEITLQENKLQAKMDKLTAKIDKVVEIIQEKEAMLKSFKQQKDMFMSSLGDLREKRLHLLLGLTSGEKSDSSPSVNERNDSRTDEGPSSSNTTRDLAPALLRGGLQTDRHQDDSSDVALSGGEGGIKISNVTSMASTTSIHRTEGFRIMFGSPTRPEGDQGHGLRDIFRDVGCNQDELGIAIGSPPMQSHASQSIEMVPQVVSRESLAKTLQELNSCGSGVTVDILSDEETLYGIGRERLMHPESLPPNSDVIEAVAQLVRGHVMSPDRDSVMQMSDVTVEPYQMAVGSDQGIVQRERTGEYGAQGSLSLRSDTEEGLSVMGLPNRNKTYETTLKRIKQEPQDHHDIGQRQEALVQGEPSLAKRKRWKEVSEENKTKRPKHNRKDPIMSKIKHEVDTLLETTSSAYPPEHDDTTIPQMESTHNYQSKVTSAPFPLGSKDNNNDNPGESSTSLKEISEPRTTQQSAHQAGDASSQEKATSSPRSKGYVINMYIIVDKLYACISDSRFIIFNLTTNTIDAEEDLALRNIKYFELWRDTAASKMVAFASDGSKNLVQFNVQGKEFLQTLVLGRDITCLHVKWNTLYAGLVNGDIASINIQKCKVSWYYDCTPSYAVTAISSTLEGGMALLITASEDRTVTIRRADDGLLLRSLGGHLDVVTHLQVLGCRVMSMARNSTILIHNLETGDLILRVKHQTKMACCVMSGDTLAMAGHTGNVYYYKIETGQADIFDSGCGNITCMTTSQDMLFLGIRDGFIDVIPLYPSKVYQCEWSHCISRFLRVDALKTHLQLIHIRRSARQCLWRSCLKNYPQKNTTVKVIEQHVFSHLKDLGKQ